MASDIKRFHGTVRPCNCGLHEHPERLSERACRMCFGRAFVAECLACDGKGQITQKMAGGPGVHSSTCTACGGVGCFGVNKPADWVGAVPEETLALTAGAL